MIASTRDHSCGKAGICLMSLLFVATISYAPSYNLPATTTGTGKINLGFYAGGTTLTLTATGQISLLNGSGFDTYPDGSLVNPLNPVGELAYFGYLNAGASGYPTIYGGDGFNHYPGGGGNFDILAGTFAFGSALTTDTTNTNTVRFGSVIGTFKANPAQFDWFLIGTGKTVVVPSSGANLYIAVSDTTYENNSGSYTVNVTASAPTLLNVRTFAGFDVQGNVGSNYRIEYSASLPSTNWTTLTNITLQQSPFLFVDTTTPAIGKRFYRAILLP